MSERSYNPTQPWKRRLPPELNTGICRVCGAQSGQQCMSLRTGKILGLTHESNAKRMESRRAAGGDVAKKQRAEDVAVKAKPSLKLVKPSERRVDGSPVLKDGQVYIMRTGSRYHPYWCDVVAKKWDGNPRGLLVTRLADVDDRKVCQNCSVV